MSHKVKLPTYDDPEEMAIKGCLWHEANEEDVRTHYDALILCGMTDPLRTSEAVTIMRRLTDETGDFHHLTLEKKYKETSKETAAARGLDMGRSVAKMPFRRIKAVEDAEKKIGELEHLPSKVKTLLAECAANITNNAARVQNAERTADLIESMKGFAASLNLIGLEYDKDRERWTGQIAQMQARDVQREGEIKFMRELLLHHGIGSGSGSAVVAA